MSTPRHLQPCPSLGHLLLDVFFSFVLVTPSSVSLFASYLSSVLSTDPQKVLFVHTEAFSAWHFLRASVVRRVMFYFEFVLVTPSSVSLFGSYLSSVLPTDPQKVLFVHTETFSALPFLRASDVRRVVFLFHLDLVTPSSVSLFASYLPSVLPTDPQKVLFVHTESFSALPFLRASVVRSVVFH